ncbi:MAG TPA: VanZ family protein [candidate division Zixibacteria bacterium]|nr:VanZ family protein [candidate division Zixibacteria bacterium]MDD4916344.1 VanZ family protein [candidate division Zixibacteria bacterium]MDM7971571.1 VanZ family protein [candidate division Zixibacteria bacterium]HOD66366.1 VanZ family protein [candidate division Zixibacteria bacterium]HPI32724.1 VanZ family protein [candidate division Zixibacteria bacterium]
MSSMNHDDPPPGLPERLLRYHLPVLLYAGGIIALSSIRDFRPPDLPIPSLDKVVHLLEYAVFAYLVFRSFYHMGRSPRLGRALLWSALFVTFFALADEMYQRYVPGRHSDWRDFVVDVLGALLVLGILGIYRWRRRRRSY